MHTCTGRQEISEAYRDQRLADDYIRSRYVEDPLGRVLHEQQARLLRAIVISLKVRRLLEVAPGPGRLTVHAPPVEFACAVEQSPAMLGIARKRLEAHGAQDWNLIQGDAFHLPVFDKQFDLVMSFKLVRHFDRGDRFSLLQNMRRVLRPGAHLLLDVANEPAYRWLHAKWGVQKGWIDDFCFTPTTFREEMREAGFPHVRLYPVQPALRLQYYTWTYLARASTAAARWATRFLEVMSLGQPLEWMALCQCE